MDQVDAVKHLSAAGAREGLADAEELLVLLYTAVSSLPTFLIPGIQLTTCSSIHRNLVTNLSWN